MTKQQRIAWHRQTSLELASAGYECMAQWHTESAEWLEAEINRNEAKLARKEQREEQEPQGPRMRNKQWMRVESDD